MKRFLSILIAALFPLAASATGSLKFDGSQKGLSYPEVEILIDEPETMIPGARTEIVLYALPNGTLIDCTVGKKVLPGEDWHLDIHHIAAQTAFLRANDRKTNYVTIYLKTRQKSWKIWHNEHLDIAKQTYDFYAECIERYKREGKRR